MAVEAEVEAVMAVTAVCMAILFLRSIFDC